LFSNRSPGKLLAPRKLRSLAPLAPIIILIFIWEGFYRVGYLGLIPSYLLPPPSAILTRFVGLLTGEMLRTHIAVTIFRVATAYFLAITIAVPIGLLLGWYKTFYRLMEPIVEFLRPIPSIGLLGFGLVVFGLGSAPIIFVAFYSCFFILLIASLYGTYSVDEIAVLVLRSMKATDVDVFRYLVLPSALPYVFGGLRQALATAWIVVVAGEMVVGSSGIGLFVIEQQRTFQIAGMYATLGMLGALGYLSTRFLLWTEHKFICWRKPGPYRSSDAMQF
jgi:NitT/TauT family transport system permease protein